MVPWKTGVKIKIIETEAAMSKCGRHFILDKDFKSSLYSRVKVLSDIEVSNKTLVQEGEDNQL